MSEAEKKYGKGTVKFEKSAPDKTIEQELIPRQDFLLHSVKKIEQKLISWCKVNKYSQGDSYTVRITKKGKWAVSYSNDYPMQHGAGQEYILTEEEFLSATQTRTNY